MKAAIWALLCIFVLPTMGLGQLLTGDIERAWRSRELQFPAVEIEWKEITISVVEPSEDPFSESTRATGEHTREYLRGLLLGASGRLRFLDTAPRWSSKKRGDISRTQITSFNGRLTKYLLSQDNHDFPERFESVGTISDTTRLRDALFSFTELQPVLHHFRPLMFEPNRLDTYSPVDETDNIDGTSCVLLRRSQIQDRTRITKSIWLDPQRTFSIRRVADDVDGRITRQITIDYSVESGAPVPSQWTLIEHDVHGRFERSIAAVVTKCVVHDTISESDFDVVFPPHTLIRDERSIGAGQQQTTFALKQADGTTRPVSEYELTHSASAAVIIDGRHKARFAKVIAWSVAALLALGILVVVRKFGMRKSSIS